MTQRRFVSLLLVSTVLALTATSDAFGQGIFRGAFTDEWENPLAGAMVIIEPAADTTGVRQETTTEEDGDFQFMGLATGDWELGGPRGRVSGDPDGCQNSAD